jgi:hypothetical protein
MEKTSFPKKATRKGRPLEGWINSLLMLLAQNMKIGECLALGG